MRRVILFLAALVLALVSTAAAQPAPASFNSNGVSISYTDRGRGTPVVLLHGFTGSASRHFERSGVIGALETAGYRVIAVDARGHGASGKPRDSAQYGLEQVLDVVRLLDHLSIPRAHVVGYSMGGAVATQLLVRHPERLITVTLIGAGWEGEDLRAFNDRTMAMADGFARGDASGLLGAVSGAGQGEQSAADVAAAVADLFSRNDPALLATIARGMWILWVVPSDQLRAATTPVLAVVGDRDPAIHGVRRMAAVVPNMVVIELPGATHQASVRPSAQHIVAFFERNR